MVRASGHWAPAPAWRSSPSCPTAPRPGTACVRRYRVRPYTGRRRAGSSCGLESRRASHEGRGNSSKNRLRTWALRTRHGQGGPEPYPSDHRQALEAHSRGAEGLSMACRHLTRWPSLDTHVKIIETRRGLISNTEARTLTASQANTNIATDLPVSGSLLFAASFHAERGTPRLVPGR